MKCPSGDLSRSLAAPDSMPDEGVCRTVNILSVNRLICTFLIACLALLSVGSQAYAAAEAAHELSHLRVPATGGGDVTGIQDIAKVNANADPAHGHDHADTCSHNHQTGVPTSPHAGLVNACSTVPRAALQPWDSREQPDSIERPKWVLTTPAVVDLLS